MGQAICMFNSSSREGAHQIGLNRDALRQNIQFLTQYATQGIKLAGVGLSYGMTMLQTFQGGNQQARSPFAQLLAPTESQVSSSIFSTTTKQSENAIVTESYQQRSSSNDDHKKTKSSSSRSQNSKNTIVEYDSSTESEISNFSDVESDQMESSSPPTPPPPRKSSSTGRVRRAASLKAQKNLQNEKPVKRKRVKRMASSVEVPLGPPSFPSDD